MSEHVPVPAWQAADAVVAVSQSAVKPDTWTVLYGQPDGTLHVEEGLTLKVARNVVREQWRMQTQQLTAGLRFGIRKTGTIWSMTERCPDGQVRFFTTVPRRKNERPAMRADTRFAVLRRDGFRCRYCGRGPDEARLHVDHVQPRSAGGGEELENLVTACQDCNLGKMTTVGVMAANSTASDDEAVA